MTKDVTRVGVVDNHEFALEGVSALLAHDPALEPTFAVTRLEDVDLSAPAPDVVVLDLFLGRDDTPSTPWIPRLTEWGAVVLLHTSCEFPVPLRQAVAAGAAGLCLKNDGGSALLAAIHEAGRGEFVCTSTLAAALVEDSRLIAELTPREVDVVTGVGDGLTQQQIARRHSISAETVKDHLQNVRRRYLALGRDVTNAHSLVREARRDGWISDSTPDTI